VTELKKCLNEGWVLTALLLICFAAGVFGAVNWADYTYPSIPSHVPGERDESFLLRIAEYHEKTDQVGKSAIIPFPVAATLCLTGFFGVAILLFVLITRLQKVECDEQASHSEHYDLLEPVPE
jgi:hypothetical protein